MTREIIEKRTRNSKTQGLGGRKFAIDVSIGTIHYMDNGWQEIDNEFTPAVAPWDWKMLKAGYHIKVKEDFTAGQIIQFDVLDWTVKIQPMALEWTNDLDQIQQVSMPHDVTPIITNPIVDLLPNVGLPSHQGTIDWPDAYGTGIDFQWKCTPSRLTKILTISQLSDLPVPQQYILDGGNPVLRLNLIFDPSNDLDIFIDGQKWDKKSKTQTFKAIEFRKDDEVLWSFMPLKYWDSSNDIETREGQSVATIEKRGNKLYISIRVPYDWLQSAIFPAFIDTDVDVRVVASFDDVGRALTGDLWQPTAGGIDVGYLNGTYSKWGSGMRFLNITIPNATTITTAHITLTCRAQYTANNVNSRISAEDVDDAPTFADDKAAFDTRWAARTTARVDWNAIGNWAVDSENDSPEIKTVIQEIIDRGSWASGNDIVIFWEDFEDRSTHTNFAIREAYQWDGSSAKAPLLHIEYSAGWGGKYCGAAITKFDGVTPGKIDGV